MSKKKTFFYILIIGVTLFSVKLQSSFMMVKEPRKTQEQVHPIGYDAPEKPREPDEEEKEVEPNEEEEKPIEERVEDLSEPEPEGSTHHAKEPSSQEKTPGEEPIPSQEREKQQAPPVQKKVNGPKTEETVFTYNFLKEKTKELGINDKIALFGLMRNMDKASIMHINGMAKGGLTEDEIHRIEQMLKRELDPKEFQKAKKILDKYIDLD